MKEIFKDDIFSDLSQFMCLKFKDFLGSNTLTNEYRDFKSFKP